LIFDAFPIQDRLEAVKIVFFVILTSQINDILEYIMGKLHGRQLQFKMISPQKTREGYSYGMAASFVICPLLFGFLLSSKSGLGIYVFTAVIIFAGALGDLIFSAIKRGKEKKDFSGLIPHHGGILDRFDSLIVALPITYYGLTRNPKSESVRWRKMLRQMVVREPRGALKCTEAGELTSRCPAGCGR